jgi:hypothetical protein
MTKFKTASNLGSQVELTDVKFFCTAKLKENNIALLPMEKSADGIFRVPGDGYFISYESSIELAVNILSEVLGTENPEMIKPIMARVKSNAVKKLISTKLRD